MDAWRPAPGLVLRPSVLIPAILVALGLAAGAFLVLPTHYISKSMIVLTIPPKGGSAGTGSASTGSTNPLLRFDGSLKVTSNMLVQTMASPDVVNLLKGLAPRTKVTVADSTKSADLLGAEGPFLLITADSQVPGSRARDAVGLAGAILRNQLDAQQKSMAAPKATYIVPVEVMAPTVPQPNLMPTIKITAAAFAVGLLGMLGFCYLAAWVAGTRRRRRARRDTADWMRPVGPEDAARPTGTLTNGSAANGSSANGSSVNGSSVNGSSTRPPAESIV